MNPSPKKLDPHAKDLFAAALEKPAAERASFLASACGDDARLWAELETLLRGFDAAEQRFEEQQAVVGEQAGDRIGHYKLLQKIGEGGFGVVWMAEQEEPVRRKVALKVLKAGMDTAQVVARFEAERQALALMDHPNIAKVFDGGATATGRPYFVMELVKGVPITQFCDDAGLGMAQRLSLFVPVCQAVQHAHQKGVIHRDLKPSNVLVTLHDGTPVAKVIDFGIAKATAGSLTQKTVFTEFRQMLGTPEYMAPEQAELSSLDVDTRADIYSLGVLLYELLTGTRPFEMKTLLQAGYAEMLRHIKEVDPPKPSTRVSTLGEQITDICKHRRVTPRAFGSLMRGDLDWIVMKAIEKERSRRYDTATALAEDVLRHLRYEPVLASPPSRLYRWRKYARRHRVGFAAITAIAVSLLTGAIVSTLAYLEADVQREAAVQAKVEETKQKDAALAAQHEADAQRRLAEQGQEQAQREATKAKTVTELLTSMLASSDPHTSKDKDYKVRQVLDDFDRSLGDRLVGEPEIEAEVRGVMSGAYQGLGLPERAEAHAQRRLEVCRALHGEQHLGVAAAWLELAKVRHDEGRHAESLELLAQTQAAILGSEPPAMQLRAEVLGWRGDLLRHLGRMEEAEAAAREGMAVAATLLPQDGGANQVCRSHLAIVLMNRGKYAEAERLLRENLVTEPFGSVGQDHFSTVISLSSAIAHQGRQGEAEALLRQSLQRERELLGENHPHLAHTLTSLGAAVFEQGRLEEGEGYLREAVAVLDRCGGGGAYRDDLLGNLVRALERRATSLRQQRRPAEAAALRREIVEVQTRRLGPDHLETYEARSDLASVLLDLRENEEGEQLLRAAMAAFAKAESANPDRVATCWHNFAAILNRKKDLAAAEDAARRSLSLRRQSPATDPIDLVASMSQVGNILRQRGRHDEAETGLRAALAMLRAMPAAPPEEVVAATQGLSYVLLAKAQRQRSSEPLAEAIEFGREALANVPNTPVPCDPDDLVDMRTNLGEALFQAGRLGEAEEVLRAGLAAAGEAPGPATISLRMRSILIVVLRDQGRAADALPLARASYEAVRAQHVDTADDVQTAATALASVLGMLGQREEALSLAQAGLTRARAAGDAGEIANSLGALALVQLDLGDFAAAAATAREFLAVRESVGASGMALASAQAMLGRALAGLGQPAEAESLLAKACPELLPPRLYNNFRHRQASLQALVDLLAARGAKAEAAVWRQRLDGLPR